MSEQQQANSGNLVPTGSCHVVPVAAANPLVVRGLMELEQGILARVSEPNQPSSEDELENLIADVKKRVAQDLKEVKKEQQRLKAEEWMLRRSGQLPPQ